MWTEVTAEADAAIDGVDTSALPAAMRRLDEAALPAMARAVGRGGLFRPGVRHSGDQVANRLRAAERHRWLLRRWLTVLCDEGWLHRDQDTGFLHDLTPVSRTEVETAAAIVPHAAEMLGYPREMGDFFAAALATLPRLLTDDIALQTLLFPDGDLTTADGAYRDNVINRYLNAAAAAILRAEAAARVPGRLRVLELGAGVGGTTAAVIDALAGSDVDYLFTDVSRFFLDAGRQRFGDRLRYAIADINTGPLPGPFDVVLAANVLHNAVHVGHLLDRLKTVLAPGGLLVVIESCREHYQALTSMQFLMSPREGAARPGTGDIRAGTDRIFLTRNEWLGLLAVHGYRPELDLPDPGGPLSALAQHVFAVRTSDTDHQG
ncbi:class I SAM-dependent methyltransferase [Saccharomonospora sp. NPDC006951]